MTGWPFVHIAIADLLARELLIQILRDVLLKCGREVLCHAGSTSAVVFAEERPLREPAIQFEKIPA